MLPAAEMLFFKWEAELSYLPISVRSWGNVLWVSDQVGAQVRVAESYLDRFRTDSSFWMSESSPRRSPACLDLSSWVCSQVPWRTERDIVSLPGWGWSPMWSLVVPCGWWWGGAAAVSTVALVSVCACLREYVHTFACMCALKNNPP